MEDLGGTNGGGGRLARQSSVWTALRAQHMDAIDGAEGGDDDDSRDSDDSSEFTGSEYTDSNSDSDGEERGEDEGRGGVQKFSDKVTKSKSFLVDYNT